MYEYDWTNVIWVFGSIGVMGIVMWIMSMAFRAIEKPKTGEHDDND